MPAVWAWALLWVVVPWLQAQGIVRLQVVAAGCVFLLHPIALYTLIYGMRLGMIGGAAANSLSASANLLIVAIAIGCCARRIGTVPLVRPSGASLSRLGTFLRLALPGVLNMGEWWASEINTLLAGLLPRPEIALSAMSIYQVHARIS